MTKVPNTFTDHTHYRQIFDHLFQYEVYTRLLGRDNDTFSHMAQSEQNVDSIGKAGRVMQYWIAEFVVKKVWGEKHPNYIPALQPTRDDAINLYLDVKRLRMYDLLLLSSEKLDLPKKAQTLNKLLTMEHLLKLLSYEHISLAIVCHTARKSRESVGIEYFNEP